MLKWLNRVNLLWMFVILLAFHLFLYDLLGTDDWFTVALLASFVDTVIVAGLQFLFREEKKGSR